MTASCETPVPRSLHVFNQIKQDVTRCGQRLAGIQSPAQKHEDDVKAVRANLDAAWDRIFQAKDLSERPQLQTKIQDYAGELERLEFSYRSGLTDAETEYERQVDAVVKACCEKLGESINTVLRLFDFERSRKPTSNDFHHDSNDSQHTSQRPQAGRSDDQSETAQNAETRKRKRGWDVLDQQKHHQLATAQKRKNVKRSIHFEEVFQNGNAPIKHVIVQWPPDQGSWYILRCEEHDFNLKDNPLVGAAAHIRSKKHGKKSSDYNTVLELLGIEVLGCDESLAEKNNVAVREAFKNGYAHPTAAGIQVSKEIVPSKDRGRTRGYRRQHGTPQAAVDPEYGQVYRVYWNLSKQWLAALLLPMQNLHDVGIPYSIEGLGLLEDLPQCYAYDCQSKTFSWKEGYEDNGPRVSMRKFPVMFFDGSPFPSKSSVAWVSASDLQIYDPSAKNLIEHSQQVLNYLEARESAGGQKIASEARTRESFPADPANLYCREAEEQAQDSGSPSSSTSWNQEAPENSQPGTTATPMITPLVETAPIGEQAFQHAPQTNSDTSALQGHPDQSPNDRSRGVATCSASGADEEPERKLSASYGCSPAEFQDGPAADVLRTIASHSAPRGTYSASWTGLSLAKWSFCLLSRQLRSLDWYDSQPTTSVTRQGLANLNGYDDLQSKSSGVADSVRCN
ncbi:Hypothetical protein NCS54_01371600 [Fusarium falciforme]|uniref:Hypothetical protein n=1 Tax=Fusarium falciforme TaxID=195108 RepID=UPI002300B34F|nr:Hypothetical protein NCS54_01371600 [Fusarium falciforme]WAO96055.1 Hypothetical protein NCS54_01371600 [Fusarium falciforme]